MKAFATMRFLFLVMAAALLAACGSSKPQPVEIPNIKADKPIQALWKFKLGDDVTYVQSFQVVQERLSLTSDD